jgi:probable HAF family extracellular repeat protein
MVRRHVWASRLVGGFAGAVRVGAMSGRGAKTQQGYSAISKALLSAGCLLWAMASPAHPVVQYTITPLGTTNGAPAGINVSGQVAGFTATAAGTDRAYLWSEGALQSFSGLGGTNRALSLNDAGQVVGYSYATPTVPPPFGQERACLWRNGVVQDLNTSGGPMLQRAYDINNAEQIVIRGATTGYLWQNGMLTDLGMEDPRAVNQAGQVVGGKFTGRLDRNGSPIEEPVLWSGGALTYLGTLGGSGNSFAEGINDWGQVVGEADTGSATAAFLWQSGAMERIPLAESRYSAAYGINNLGQVVGRMYPPGLVPPRAFLFSGGVAADLNDLISGDLGWVLTSAYAINDAGQIVGTGTYGGDSRMFLLTPVPEPGSVLLLCAGAIALVFRRR